MPMKHHTKEWNAWWIRKMQSFTVLAKVLGTRHESAHLLQDGRCTATNLCPCAAKSVDRRRTQSGDDGCQCRKVVEGTAFLSKVSSSN